MQAATGRAGADGGAAGRRPPLRASVVPQGGSVEWAWKRSGRGRTESAVREAGGSACQHREPRLMTGTLRRRAAGARGARAPQRRSAPPATLVGAHRPVERRQWRPAGPPATRAGALTSDGPAVVQAVVATGGVRWGGWRRGCAVVLQAGSKFFREKACQKKKKRPCQGLYNPPPRPAESKSNITLKPSTSARKCAWL